MNATEIALSSSPQGMLARLSGLLNIGGPMMWLIALLSVASLTLILWKALHLYRMGIFGGGRRSAQALALWQAGQGQAAIAAVAGRKRARAMVVYCAMVAAQDGSLDQADAEAETERVARNILAQARKGLRGLELAAAIGPLLGLLGTVTGMIAAFQGLQAAGARADTATLAGGIWEALLTTAAGMGVAIPAMIALTWFDSVLDGLRHDMEDDATRVFLRHARKPLLQSLRTAAE
ncbi:MAG: MotA/TolQ/ExbB proton channel family protein [Cypionkella sp.]